MEFKKFSAGIHSYGKTNPEMKPEQEKVENVNFECELFESHWNSNLFNANKPAANPRLVDFMTILAVCHTVIVEDKNGTLHYNASSPDELALANAARHFGMVFMERGAANNIEVHNKLTGQTVQFDLLNVIEFTSTRKRMSVVVRHPDGRILVMMKGADSIVMSRLRSGQTSLVDKTSEFLTAYANEGLRTLMVAQKEISEKEYRSWSKRY